ncbi:MAG TPA: trypsin-like peptidase domain-containing protein [Pseudonocardiaceae bacterium]
MSEVDPPGYPGTGSDSPSAGRPTVEYPLSIARTDRSSGWEPLSRRHSPRLLIILLVAFVSVIAVGVIRVAWPAAATAPPWPSSTAAFPWASPIAALPVTSGTPSGSLDLASLAAGVDPAVVDINTQLGDQNDSGAGTGIVLSPSGEVLTNNHVINGATSITATDVGNGQVYPATVVGYDSSHDLAVLQLQGASGLQTASIGDSSAVAVGDEIAAIGNAGGRGGTPSVTAGTVSALDQMVTVSDEITGSSQELAGLIQVAADVQPGDSGGPLVNTAGEVIGVVTAGSGGTRWQSSGGDGLAIPINDAIAISKQIRTGTASATVHIGDTGVLGIQVQDPTAQATSRHRGNFGYRHGSDASGVLVAGVLPGSPAAQSGLSAGDVIVSVDAAAVDSAAALTTVLAGHHPGDMMRLAWVDVSGNPHTATLLLATGPPN